MDETPITTPSPAESRQRFAYRKTRLNAQDWCTGEGQILVSEPEQEK